MSKKYIIYAPFKMQFFEGTDLEGALFGNERPRFFNSKEEAEERLKEEYVYKPEVFISLGIITILETFDY